MKIGMWVEGSTDKAFFPPLVARNLNLDESDLIVSNRRGRCIQGVKPGFPAAYQDFLASNCTHLIVCADNHNTSSGHRARVARDIRSMVQIPCAIAVAVESFEAWLLADNVTLCDVMKIPRKKKPPRVEKLPEPKAYLFNYLEKNPTYEEISEFARKMNCERARREAPSFDDFLSEISDLKDS